VKHTGWWLVLTVVACAPAEFDAEPVSAQQEALTAVSGFGANPGGLSMFVHVPPSLPPNPALVVAMHGCTQSASAYTNAGWNALADQYGFLVLYPQTTANNSCFSWFIGVQQSRTGPEVTSIMSMVNHLRTTRSVDPSRIFVTGLSAGGAMTTVLLSTHPDVFRAGAVMAGLPFACATTQLDAFNCMNSPPDRTPQQWGDLVRAVPGTSSFPAPRVSIWHGTSDFTVRPGNLTELVDQWTNVNAIDAVADSTSTVGVATRREYRNAQGQTRVESWSLANMSHGTAVDPRRGCGTAGAFILDVQVCSSRFAAEFFGLVPVTSLDAGVVTDAGAPTDAGSPSTDAGTPVDAGAPDAGPRPDAGGFQCREFTAANFTHVGALRATACGGGSASFCAVGSGDDLGTVNTVTSVREVAPGFFERGTCAGGTGGGSAGGGMAGGGAAGGGAAGGAAFACVEHAGFNYEHVVAFRAQSCPAAAAACAVGSGDNLGLFSNRTTLREVRPGFYELGACPTGAGGGTAGGASGGVTGGMSGGAAGGASGGAAAGGVAGGTSGGSGGGASGGSAGAAAGGSAAGGVAGGTSGGSSGGAAGGSAAGGMAGGTSGGASGGASGGGSASAGGASGGAPAAGGGGTSMTDPGGCGCTEVEGFPVVVLGLLLLRRRR
jgi:poly(hydroxyalkanoate) depolymerase family esterase